MPMHRIYALSIYNHTAFFSKTKQRHIPRIRHTVCVYSMCYLLGKVWQLSCLLHARALQLHQNKGSSIEAKYNHSINKQTNANTKIWSMIWTGKPIILLHLRNYIILLFWEGGLISITWSPAIHSIKYIIGFTKCTASRNHIIFLASGSPVIRLYQNSCHITK